MNDVDYFAAFMAGFPAELPDQCPGCGDTEYSVGLYQTGHMSGEFRCECGSGVAGWGGIPFERVQADWDAFVADMLAAETQEKP